MRDIILLGSTGSIGVQALEVMEAHGLRPAALAARRNVKLMEEQARKFAPDIACMSDEAAGRDLAVRLRDTQVKVVWGEAGLLEAASYHRADAALNALVGLSGLNPTLAALAAGHKLLLANKESLVCAGETVTALAGRNGLEIVPVDSEHSAIYQCMRAGRAGIRRLILTASGGAFRGWSRERLEAVTPAMALKHPNWSMGAKVTVDSATLLNKGLEVIEAMWLFDVPVDKISVLVHPQSIVHSLVEYNDGGMLAQLGAPDMRLPIQYALLDGAREPCPGPGLELSEAVGLTFEPPDIKSFPCLALAFEAARLGGNSGAVLCGAGEAAVELFLDGKIGFMDIPRSVERAMSSVARIQSPGLEDILASDSEAREIVKTGCSFV